MCPHICCKSMFEMFQLFQSYVAISVLMLQVASILSEYCISFTHMLQVYVPNVSFTSDICCIHFMLQVFHISEVCSESHESMAWAPGERAR
jgi:hypothetical protein